MSKNEVPRMRKKHPASMKRHCKTVSYTTHDGRHKVGVDSYCSKCGAKVV